MTFELWDPLNTSISNVPNHLDHMGDSHHFLPGPLMPALCSDCCAGPFVQGVLFLGLGNTQDHAKATGAGQIYVLIIVKGRVPKLKSAKVWSLTILR